MGERYCGENNAHMLPCVHGENSYSTSNFFNQLVLVGIEEHTYAVNIYGGRQGWPEEDQIFVRLCCFFFFLLFFVFALDSFLFLLLFLRFRAPLFY